MNGRFEELKGWRTTSDVAYLLWMMTQMGLQCINDRNWKVISSHYQARTVTGDN